MLLFNFAKYNFIPIIAKYFANFLLNPITPHAIMNLMWKSLGRMMVVQKPAHVLDGFFKGCGLSWDCYE